MGNVFPIMGIPVLFRIIPACSFPFHDFVLFYGNMFPHPTIVLFQWVHSMIVV